MYNTRIAPSPTGLFHIGTARTAYFNWLAARATGGRFLLRIDDTDTKRNQLAYEQVILESLHWLGLDFDVCIRQSERTSLYHAAAEKLLNESWAFRVDGGAICFRTQTDWCYKQQWHDEIIGDIAITPDDLQHMEGMVLIKSDGTPAYNFATVVDDQAWNINYVIRGVDHITNTAKQAILWHILDPITPLPKFAHVGLICKQNAPLSKRDGASSLLAYRDTNYHPEAMLNFLARLGWGPAVDDKTTALLPRDRMRELFLAGGKMRSTPANLDLAKLDSFNRKYTAREKQNETRDLSGGHASLGAEVAGVDAVQQPKE